MSNRDSELLHLIALSQISGIGPVKAKALIAYCGSATAIFKEKKKNLLRIPDIGLVTAEAIFSEDSLSRAEEELNFILKNGISTLSFYQEDYPERLRQCPDAPIVLFTKGNLNLNNAYAISIVGTRKATNYGRDFCDQLIASIQPLKPLIISGLAYGIDIAAHKSAIQHNLPTAACLAHGLDRIYPPLHSSAARDMLQNGGLVSEFISGTNPDRELFPTRNRIIAGLADCVVVVETDKKGGSIITAHIANSYGRDVFAVPGRHNDTHSLGCNELIKKNLAAILTSPDDLVEYMNWSLAAPQSKQLNLFGDLDDVEKNVCLLLRNHAKKAIDQLVIESKLPQTSLSSVLLELEFKGIVRALPGKQYCLA